LAESPGSTFIRASDHIYKMNYREMLDWHLERQADITVATPTAPIEEAVRFWRG
jgi:glucose-1-phosphate adenylyltransferase